MSALFAALEYLKIIQIDAIENSWVMTKTVKLWGEKLRLLQDENRAILLEYRESSEG